MARQQSKGAKASPRKLADRFGRVADDLRISLIDKCNLRCTYCMPAEGMDWMPQKQLLSTEEAVRIADIGVRIFGVKDIRFTGGEPLVRRDLEEIVAGVRKLHPEVSIALTTNAIGLEKRVAGLAEAGLSRINISLDTICPETFERLSRRNRLADVLSGVDAALAAGLDPVKINAVLMRGVNEDQAPELLEWCLQRGLQLRFIEQMPLDADHRWSADQLVDAAEIRQRLGERFELTPASEPRGSAPAQLWDVRDRVDTAREGAGENAAPEDAARVRGQVGVIASVTEPFCADCTRTRVTADGKVRSCLFSHGETDLMDLLRGGAKDEEIAERWQHAMWLKPRAHGTTVGQSGIPLNSPEFRQPGRSMSAIGG